MTEEDLANIESTFNVQLPPIYRNWALVLPAFDDESDNYDFNIHFFTDPEVIVYANQHVRESGWSLDHFVIGDQDGNFFFIDLADPTTSDVFCAKHDEEPFYDLDTFAIAHCRIDSSSTFFTDGYRNN